MKKLTALLLSLVMAISLVACANNSGSSDSSGNQNSTGNTSNEGADTGVDYPTGPINILVPSKAGGGTDLSARILAKYLEEELGQSVIVTNQDGASGGIAAQSLFSAEPDGHTLYYFHNSLLLASVRGLVDFVPQEKMAPVAMFCRDTSLGLFVSADSGITNMEEFVADAKANPDKYSMPINMGGASQLLMLALNEEFGINIRGIDMTSDSEKIAALLGGTVNVIPVGYSLAAQYVENGDFNCIGLVNTGAEENPYVPEDVLSLSEQGYDFSLPGYDFHLYAAAETDPAIIEKISDAIANLVEKPEVQEDLANLGYYAEYMNPQDLKTHLDEMYDFYMGFQDLITG